MKELRNKIAAVIYYYGALVASIEGQDDLPKDLQDAINHYYKIKDEILNEITKDKLNEQ